MKERQVSFSGGELAPALWGRTDLSRYATGARELTNFVVSAQGTVVNRTGTQNVLYMRDGTVLVPFVVSATESYVLVFQDGHNQFIVCREDPDNPRYGFSDPVTFGLGFLDAHGDMFTDRIRWAQSGDYLTIVMRNRPPFEIKYVSATDWEVTEIDLTAEELPLQNGVGHENRYPRMRFSTFQDETDWTFIDASHVARPWRWALTWVIRRAKDRKLYETQKYVMFQRHVVGTGTDEAPEDQGAVIYKHAIYPDQIREFWTSLAGGSSLDNGDVLVASRLYRGRDGRFGFVAETTGTEVEDDGSTPDFSNPPPSGTSPFEIWQNGIIYTIEYPTVAAFFERRRYLASTTERPSTVWGSSVELNDNFDEVLQADDADSLEFTLVGKTRQTVKWLVDLGGLLVGTTGGVWLAKGSGESELLTPNSIWTHLLFNKGVGDVPPADAGGQVFFTDLKGGAPFVVSMKGGQYEFVDVSLLATHLFEGYTVIDWAYSSNPHRVLWTVRSDGALLSLTYVPELEITAWAKHEIAGDGLVESICTKPEAGEDGVWITVNRNGTRYLERLAYRVLPLDVDGEPDVRYAVYLDRAASYNGQNDTDGLTITASGALGESITLTLGSGTLAVGDIVQVDDPLGGLPYKFLVLSDDGGGDYTAQIYTRDVTHTDFSAALTGWWLCSHQVSGLMHIRGQQVTVLADGNVWREITVDGTGTASIGEGNEAAILHAGLSYDCDFDSLDAANEKGRQKVIQKVTVELEHTRGGEVGTDFDHTTRIKNRTADHGYLTSPLVRREERVLVTGAWDTSGRVVLRQSDPLPITILGISREYDLGG